MPERRVDASWVPMDAGGPSYVSIGTAEFGGEPNDEFIAYAWCLTSK
jgi:hypothetical protein